MRRILLTTLLSIACFIEETGSATGLSPKDASTLWTPVTGGSASKESTFPQNTQNVSTASVGAPTEAVETSKGVQRDVNPFGGGFGGGATMTVAKAAERKPAPFVMKDDAPAAMVEKGKVELDAGRFKKAEELLSKALADGRLVGPERGRAAVLLARAQRLDGGAARAVETLSKILDSRDPWHNIELGEARLALRGNQDALKAVSDYSAKNPAELFAHASWVTARADFEIRDYLSCIKACADFLKAAAVYKKESKAEKREVEELSKIASKAEELREKAQELFDIANYGVDFANYRKARKAEFASHYDEAIKFYAKIQSGILAKAAALYTTQCLTAKAEHKEAKKRLGEIMEALPPTPPPKGTSTLWTPETGGEASPGKPGADASPQAGNAKGAGPVGGGFGGGATMSNPYAGEAVLDLAEMEYVEHGAARAIERLRVFDMWVESEEKAVAASRDGGVGNGGVRRSRTARDLELLAGINDALWNDVIEKMPKKYLDADDFGNLVRSARLPEGIVNSRTSPWYMPWLKVRAALLKGHLLCETGEKEKGIELFRSALTPSGGVSILSDSTAIDALCAAESEGYPPPLPVLSAKKLSKERKASLAVASLRGIAGDTSRALQDMKALAAGAAASKRDHDLRAVTLCLASALVENGEASEAQKILEAIRSGRRPGFSSLDVKIEMLYAGLLARDPAKKSEAIAIYKLLINRKNGGAAVDACLALALLLANQGDAKGALAACAEATGAYPATPQAAAAAALAAALREDVDAKPHGGSLPQSGLASKQPVGKLTRHARVLVVPGTANWEIDPATVSPTDVIQYRIRCVSRDNCKILRSFAVTLRPGEPQPPRSKTNELMFYRSPLLAGLARPPEATSSAVETKAD